MGTNPLLKSWRTAAAGICGFVVALGIALTATWDDDPDTEADWNTVVVAAIAAVGFITARDNNVTSEEAGAQTPAKLRAVCQDQEQSDKDRFATRDTPRQNPV